MPTKSYPCKWCEEVITVTGPHPAALFAAHVKECKKHTERERLRKHHETQKHQQKEWGQRSRAARTVSPPQGDVPPPSDPEPLRLVAQVRARTRTTMERASVTRGFDRLLTRHAQSRPSFPSAPTQGNSPEIAATILAAFEDADADTEEPTPMENPEAPPKNLGPSTPLPTQLEPLPPPENVSEGQPAPFHAPPGEEEPIARKAQRLLRPGGFQFTDRESIMQNLSDFGEVRKHFLLVDKFDALAELYDCFFMSFVDAYGGYGMDDHKKKVFLKENARIQRTFEHLKGETRPGKENADLRRYIETNLFRRLRTMIGAASMDTLSQREADRHQRLLKLAEAMIATEEEGGELRNLLDSLKRPKEENP